MYPSNYPSNYGASPYGGGGGYGGPAYPGGGGYGGYTSAYNVNSNPYQMGSVPPPGGQYGYQGQSGAVPGFTVPAVQSCAGHYGGQQVAPPPMPSSYNNHAYYQQQMNYNMQMQQMQRDALEKQVRESMKQSKRKNKKGRKKKRQEDEDDDDEEEEEEDVEVSQEELQEEVKKKHKQFFLAEQLRRVNVSGTLDFTSGTVKRFIKYTKSDPEHIFAVEKGLIGGDEMDWNPEIDCAYLRDAIQGLGTKEEHIIHMATTRNNEQRQEVKKMYKTMYGDDLIKDLRGDLSFNFLNIITALYVPPAEYDAWCIKEAIYGLGTDERALIEILLTRTNPQIQEMRRVYDGVDNPHYSKKGSKIEKDIEGDCSGDFKKLLYSACQGNRSHMTPKKIEDAIEEIEVDGQKTGMFKINEEKLVDMAQAKRDAKNLFKAGEDRWGTDEETFVRIFAVRDFYQLRATYNEYVKLTQRDIENSIDRETSGDFRKGLCAIATCIKNRPRFFAKELRSAMKGLGTSDSRLIRIITSRSEIDMEQIKKEFLEENKQTLYMWLENDCSGDYKKTLQAIVGKN